MTENESHMADTQFKKKWEGAYLGIFISLDFNLIGNSIYLDNN